MRTRSLMMVAAVLLMAAGAQAQNASGPAATPDQDTPKVTPPVSSEFEPVNQIDFGIRGTSFKNGSDEARFQRYRDVSDGGTLDRIRFFKDTDNYRVNLQADHVGYLDQRFFGSYSNYGNLKTSFEWNQTPLNYSYSTRTLYTETSPGVLVLPGGVQSGIQGKTLTLQNAVTNASLFDTQSKRSVADFNLLYNATPNLDVNVTMKNTLRNGTQPMSAGFGFSTATDELAAPIDTRTTEFGASAQYGNDRAYAKLGYDASFFRNDIKTLTWANPMRATDISGGSSNGRLTLWPNTDQNTISASGGVNKLPGRSNVSAYISYAAQSNNDPLMPFTVNSAIASPALPRQNADVQARVTAMNFNFTSRPANPVWFNVRYRQYNFNDNTSPFFVADSVSYDSTPAPGVNIMREEMTFARHTFDADASYSPVTFFGIRGGYTREIIDRTYRWFDTTTEDVGRVSADLTGMKWVTLRGIYEKSRRRSSALNEEAVLEAGEHLELGQYDIANRDRDRATAIVIVTPVSAFSVNASAGWIKDNYPASYFGLRNSENQVYSVGFDAVPIENKVNFGASYGWEKNTSLQYSRYAPHVSSGANPNFDDPASDWFDNAGDRARTASASVEIIQIIPKMDLKLGYDYSKADSSYLYTIPAGKPIPNYTSATGAIGQQLPVQVPSVTNELQRGTVDALYHLTNHLGVGFVYWFDSYVVNDFSLAPQPNGLVPSPATVATPSIMMLGYNWLPYTAHTYWGRLSYRW